MIVRESPAGSWYYEIEGPLLRPSRAVSPADSCNVLSDTSFEHRSPGYQSEFVRPLDQGVSTADEIDTTAIDAFYPPARLLDDVVKPKLARKLPADLL